MTCLCMTNLTSGYVELTFDESDFVSRFAMVQAFGEWYRITESLRGTTFLAVPINAVGEE